MKLLRSAEIDRRNDEFAILTQSEKSQIAIMVLPPGGQSGSFGSDHPEADQTLIVLTGRGEATVEREVVELNEGDALLIEAGERHQIRNSGKAPLRTLNVYAPPGY